MLASLFCDRHIPSQGSTFFVKTTTEKQFLFQPAYRQVLHSQAMTGMQFDLHSFQMVQKVLLTLKTSVTCDWLGHNQESIKTESHCVVLSTVHICSHCCNLALPAKRKRATQHTTVFAVSRPLIGNYVLLSWPQSLDYWSPGTVTDTEAVATCYAFRPHMQSEAPEWRCCLVPCICPPRQSKCKC